MNIDIKAKQWVEQPPLQPSSAPVYPKKNIWHEHMLALFAAVAKRIFHAHVCTQLVHTLPCWVFDKRCAPFPLRIATWNFVVPRSHFHPPWFFSPIRVASIL
jgi:hypothetical protein